MAQTYDGARRRPALLPKVELMIPTLICENCACESGVVERRYLGSLVAPPGHGPRSTPGLRGGSLVGYAASNQSMFTSVSSQSDSTSTMPRSRAAPISRSAPLAVKSSKSPNLPFCLLQKSSVMELPAPGPKIVASEFGTTTPSWT